MALRFTTTLMLLATVAALDTQGTEVSSDELVLLQNGLSAKAKKLQQESPRRDAEMLDSEASALNGGISCPSISLISDALLMDGAACASAAKGVQVNLGLFSSDSMRKQSKVDVAATSAEQTGLSETDESATASHLSDSAPSSVIRYILNLFTLAVLVDIVRRLSSSTGSCNAESVGEAPRDMSVRGSCVDGCDTMFRAVQDSDVVAVQALLDGGLPLNPVDAWDETPLHHAARVGAIDVCKLLLARGARIDSPNAQEWTPLVAAGSAGKRAMCEWLLAHGATQGDLEESLLPPLLQALLKPEEPESEPEIHIADLEAKAEADLVRRVLQPKPEWEELESMPVWEDDDDVPYFEDQ